MPRLIWNVPFDVAVVRLGWTVERLEVDSGGELANARVVGLGQGYGTKGAVSEGGVGAAEVGCVEDVEELATNFEAGVFAEDELFEERGIHERVDPLAGVDVIAIAL